MDFLVNESMNKETLTLVTASSAVLDMNQFKLMKGNVIFDNEPDLNRYPILSETKVILVKNNSIDSILVIKAMLVSKQLNYLNNY
jgi:hypothetical protein